MILLPYDYFIKNDQIPWYFWGTENWQNGHNFLSRSKNPENYSFSCLDWFQVLDKTYTWIKNNENEGSNQCFQIGVNTFSRH